jgi:cobalt-zinc-cadmium efflux system outer membrane protein
MEPMRSIRLIIAVIAAAPALLAQPQRLTRADAIEAAVSRGARLAFAAADTNVARALGLAARAFPNPSLSAAYSKDTPQYHLSLDLPVDYPWLRDTRIKAAAATQNASRFRFRFERAAAALDADTLYTLAQAQQAHLQLSRRNALDADSLRRIAVARRDAGDASDLDVELASLFAGEQRNAAANDSLAYLDVVLSLQTVMGLPADSARLVIADSLVVPAPANARGAAGTPLSVAAAQAGLEAAELVTKLERRNRWAPPNIMAGFDTRDPGGTGNKLLPTFGLTLPLPLLDWNRGPVALADAERDRARIELALARSESQAAIARASREREMTLARVQRGAQLVSSANRVATMSLTAFREGAATLASVLEAQRSARDILRNYIDDLARAWIAIATTRVLTLTVTPDGPQ